MKRNGILLFIIAFIILLVFLPSFSQMQDLKQKNSDYADQIEYLEAKNKKLLEEKRLLEEDPEYLEKVAREKMRVVREGEVLYRLTPMNAEMQ